MGNEELEDGMEIEEDDVMGDGRSRWKGQHGRSWTISGK
jgi:hypothetical protein